jgi:hypothetical protein
MYILARNNAGTAANFSTRQVSFFAIGSPLPGSGLQPAFYTAFISYLNSL